MPSGVFVIHWDDFRGLLVEKRYPTSLSLTEKDLNLVYYQHQQGEKAPLKYIEVGGMKIASFVQDSHPGWIVCFVLSVIEDMEIQRIRLCGMGRFILELILIDPDHVDIEQIIEHECILDEPEEEQKLAEIFLTPSSALLLEKMQQEGVESAARLSMWLKSQVQTEVDIRDVAAPLMRTDVVRVERIGKTTEAVFLVKDVFGYRAPPVDSIQYSLETMPPIGEEYLEYVTGFFSPPPPNKGYNPAIPVDDPNSPIMEDREIISGILVKRFHYVVLQILRERPHTVSEISAGTNLPIEVVQNVLWSLESDKVTVQLKGTDHWALMTNPTIDSFIPEHVLPTVARKVKEKEITPETAKRYLEILIQKWGEKK